jgi:two-component system chemotaxis response regulator CheB
MSSTPDFPRADATGADPTIEVMVVDDSAVVRQRLKSVIESDTRFRVILAADPYEAVALLSKSVPGVIVLDVEMPRMDGLTFLRKLMSQIIRPIPVVLCTSIADRALSALEMGALEVIPKPDWRDPVKMAAWAGEFLDSVRNAVGAGRAAPLGRAPGAGGEERSNAADEILARRAYMPRGGSSEPIVAIGVSTGGVQTMPTLLSGFPRDAPGMVIVQHMPTEFMDTYASRLTSNPNVQIEVAVAKHQEPIRPGRALVIPGEVHGLIRRTGVGYRVELVEGPKINRFRPSVDMLFRSAAQAAGPHAAGIILTGMLDDGARGLLEMREAGSMTVAQDEATCIVFGMPKEAIRRGAAKFVHPLDRIAPAVMAWAAGLDPGSRG